MKQVLLGLFFVIGVYGSYEQLPLDNPHYLGSRSGIVHLFEWTFLDIARECEVFLGPNGYAGVQTSPANEYLIIKGRPWYERYQPISYIVKTRSGDAKDYKEMTRRCRDAGILIFTDVVPNHMSANADNAVGTAGSTADTYEESYPGVPYNKSHFHHPTCQMTNISDPINARVCELASLHDLNQTMPYVQEKIEEFLNHLTKLGAAGFRVDAAKHMFPEDLKEIYSNLEPLSKDLGLPDGAYPFVYQEVGDDWKYNYTFLGAVTEFNHAMNMAGFFKKDKKPSDFENYGGPHMDLMESESALVFVDNHDLQRQNSYTINYKTPRNFTAAYVFTLGTPYGIPRIMSSFDFDSDQDGPPHDDSYNIVGPTINSNGQCEGGWVCEHRWPAIANMITFRKVVGDSKVTNFKGDDDKGTISFCRGNKGFVFISSGNSDVEEEVSTCLPEGVYCDLVSQKRVGDECDISSGIYVDSEGKATIKLPMDGPHLAVAFHVESMAE